MASDASERRPKSGVLPAKFRTLVNDMKRFRIHRREKKGAKGAMPEPTSTSEVLLTPESTKPIQSIHSSLPATANLAVQVTITFDEPLNYSYTRNYEASPSLQATEAMCQGLLRRVDHCCHELITRKDSTAMEYAAASGSDKPLRFEIQVDIIRGWSEIWASRTFKSYQKQLLSVEAAREVIISTHHIIGLFLRQHDEGFVWKDGPVRDDPLDDQGKFPHRAGRVQPMSCVPRSYFLEKSQSFELVPGYTVAFSFTSRCQRRKPSEWHTTVEVNSAQAAPLNSIGIETLFFETSYALEGVLRSERQAFEKVHSLCVSLDGCKDCRHHDNDGLELQFSVMNNLGPQFPRLERTIYCNSNLSFHSDAQECMAFVNKVETALAHVRDATDDIINRMNDLEFRITELRGHGWSLEEPLIFILDSSKSFSQRNIEAVLDRIQAGITDILRGNAISVRMTAHKRGHFILDKTFVAREPFEPTEKKAKQSRRSKAFVLDRLQQRVERDIAMICKDTITLDDADEETGTVRTEAGVLEQSPTHDADVSVSVSGLETTESISRVPTEQHEDSPCENQHPETSAATSISEGMAEDYNLACKAANPDAPEERELSVPPSPTRCRPFIPARKSSSASAAIFIPETGARAFPLVPDLDSYVESEGAGLDKDHEKRIIQAISDEPLGGNVPHQLAARISRPNTAHETMASQEKEPAVTNSGEEPAYEPSIASSTPSLVFGDGSSPDSSLLITPKKHRLSPDVDHSKNAIIDSDDDEARDSGIDVHQDFGKSQPFPSPTLRHARPVISSPLRVSQTVQDQSPLSIPAISNAPSKSIIELADQTFGQQSSSAPSITHIHHASTTEIDTADAFTSELPSPSKPQVETQSLKEESGESSPSTEPELPNLPSQPETEESENENGIEFQESTTNSFAQSKPDFTFSSPPAISSPSHSESGSDNPNNNNSPPNPIPILTSGSGSDNPNSSIPSLNPNPPRLQIDMSPDPSEADIDSDAELSPPSRPLTQRSSFGSAGVLGFHEQMFGSLSLRSALIRSRPGSSGDFSVGEGRSRPGTAVSHL
ncbi:uncharacterized protein GGS22DRAFT_149832 [Annulohypoxylon maeteangense]|uniref:uncharacterized protein n=1 Tax=Annulohypoxylon maeteangense TaxID=1927788 RepID=UPI0020084FBA|nr:uncharacterized protein GGS22DRAFT_149832 [Annulohypoxylon maeteangense]KAI0890031.1 hypothetical protein GGS22DRAFT_149832 [Annulohypoxylon maeteangense]